MRVGWRGIYVRLCDLLKDMDIETRGGLDVEIDDLEYDSRKVKAGDLFFCIVGMVTDGHSFAAHAVENGARALIVERWLELDVPQVLVGDTRTAMSEISASFFGHPAKRMTMIGITGTNGKTTTTYMVKSMAEQMGKKVGLIGTITNLIGSKRIPTERTTPESCDLQRILKRMADEGVETVVMEVSSHALEQRRVHGIMFNVGVFTNLTQDHLDYHKSFENYRACKKMLFAQSWAAVINADDPNGAFMASDIDIPVITFGIRVVADISASDIDITTSGVQFVVKTPTGSESIFLAIPGLFSVFNAMAACGVAHTLGYPMWAVKQGLERMTSVSGRLEPLNTHGRDFAILLDYAHTPDALENILKTVHEFAKGRIITLFGCGGDRDRAKRPIMGEVAGRYSDFLIVTSDNPRTEEPMDIIAAIEEGVRKSGCDSITIENRREAIRHAIEHARRDDVIILAGKGHETYQEIQGAKYPFDEKEIVDEILKELA